MEIRELATQTHVSIQGRQWLINGQAVHPGSPAEGLLINVRMVNSVFEDTGPAAAAYLPKDFDPQFNTQRFIRQIPSYVQHGVIAFTLCLQGGLPGYEGAVNSAFNSDGSLRGSYMHRVALVIEACDQHRAAVILSCFYQRQHSHERALAGRDAIRQAVTNVALWIRERDYRNVVLEIANEYRHSGFAAWVDGDWLVSDAAQVELIQLARKTAPGLLVSTSGMGSGVISESIANEADFLLIHFNNTALMDIPQRVNDIKRYGKPIVCNEDNKLGATGAETARLAITHGAAWGFMHAPKNQSVPFEFEGVADDPQVYAMLKQLTTPGVSTDTRPAMAVTASVLITQPKDGDTFAAGKPIVVYAAVTETPSQRLARVEVFANGRMIGTAAAAPWHITWTNPAAGRYDLVAMQFDAQGGELARSNPVDIVVTE